MSNTKVNLTVVVPGATILSKRECLKQLKKPVINTKGKYAGKQARDKKGNLLYHHETVPDLSKYDRHNLSVSYQVGFLTGTKYVKETLTYYTRKCREAKQVINLSEEAYDYFVSKELPAGYHAPKDFKPYAPIRSHLDRKSKKYVEGISLDMQAWRACSPTQRLEWHLNAICESMGGRMDSYAVFND